MEASKGEARADSLGEALADLAHKGSQVCCRSWKHAVNLGDTYQGQESGQAVQSGGAS